MIRGYHVAAGLALCLMAAQAQAQWSAPRLTTPLESPLRPQQTSGHDWLQPVASVVVPGGGQLMAGRDRAALYLIAEAFLWSKFLAHSGEGRREREEYRNLAFDVARARYSPARRDTSFAYFEKMEQFVESGAFDTDPGPALIPPTDERTYNGTVWRLARETFFDNPDVIPDTASTEYRNALAFYLRRAVGPNFQWSWRDAGLEQDLFRQSIRQSDTAFKSATQYLGLIIANHLMSAVDAFVSYRLSRRENTIRLTSALLSTPGVSGGWSGGVTVAVAF